MVKGLMNSSAEFNATTGYTHGKAGFPFARLRAEAFLRASTGMTELRAFFMDTVQ